jgi:hypothetical protein
MAYREVRALIQMASQPPSSRIYGLRAAWNPAF